MAKKLNMSLVLVPILCLILSQTVFAITISDLDPVEQVIAEQAVDNYMVLGLTETEAIAQVEAVINEQFEAQIPVRTGNRWGIELSESEKELIARMVYLEAGNQTQNDSLGKKVVVAVFLNRMVDGRFGGTSVEDVMFAPGQFHTSESLQTVARSNWEAQIWVVDAVLNGDTATDGMTYLYFRSNYPRGDNDVKIQDHWFSDY